MAILPKAIYRFNAIPIKIPRQFFTDLERAILNFIWRNKKPRITKCSLYKKAISRGITIPDFKLYYRATVLKTAWYWHQNRHVDQWNRIEDPDINPHRSISVTMHKTQVQVDQRPQHKSVTLNLIEEKVGSTLERIGTGDHFLNITPTAQTLGATINQWDYMKLRSFCKAKDIITKTKHQPTEWEKIFTNPTSHRGLISRIYKELKKHDIKTPNSPIEKWAVELNREFTAEEYRMAERHLRKCSTSLLIREMQIKTILRYHLTPVRMAKIKKHWGQFMLERMWSKRNTSPLLLGMQIGTTTMESSMANSQKIGNHSSSRPNHTTPGHIPKECPVIPQGHMLNYVHSSFIFNSQNLETT
ncbi:hypothetical protein STEG23_016842 [Scotinomys teguina]